MMAESWVAHHLGILQEVDFAEISEFLKRLSRHFVVRPTILNARTLIRFARSDKKSVSSSFRMSLPAEIGKMHMASDGDYKIQVPVEIFSGSIRYLREVLLSHRRI
jgi:3-dehydroquinate synthetase